jgi:hypothetical protein
MLGAVGAGVIGCGLVVLGVFALVDPERASGAYGVPALGLPAQTWVRAAGVRDLVLGLVFGVLLAHGDSDVLSAVAAISAIVALGDIVLVRAGRPRTYRMRGPAVLVHSVGAVALLVVAALLYLGR